MNGIPYGRQEIRESDIEEVASVLKSDFLTTGSKVDEFEKEFAQYAGSKYAVSVSSGTAALHLACLAAGLGAGEELITSPMTFAASANCALYCGARPVFVDVDENGLIDPQGVEEKITEKTKVLLPVHYTGLPCDMESIKGGADAHNLTVIEDASHALGSTYKDSRIGDCKYSDMAIFSFHPVKHITTGEGGMITTNSEALYEKLKILRNHGITKDKNKFVNESKGPWYYEQQMLGLNYRLTDIQCALGINQLKRIGEFVGKRREIAKRYDEAFEKNENVEVLKEGEGQFNSYHLYVIKLKGPEERLRLFNKLREENIFCQVHYIPVYWHPYYQKQGYARGLCPKAEEFYGRIMSLPIYSSLKEEDQKKVIDLVQEGTGWK